ncbi:MAG TPA: hypothetical protein VK553_05625 [Candidatus Nitrosopolaris rasttigaisensis]|nr:hypothetical protein [Candidatus Nitrosopolaris rasttigaisensis]
MPADSQKEGKAMSGGQRIDDHSFWGGKPGKDSRFPDGPHKCKNESSAEGVGSLMKYEDTTEQIREQQVKSDKQAKSLPMKPHYRG